MNRRVETIKLDNGYLTKVWSETAPEAYAVECAAQAVPPPSAYKPRGDQPNPSEAFDPEERWPSDATATDYPPNCEGNNSAGAVAEVLAARMEGDE